MRRIAVLFCSAPPALPAAFEPSARRRERVLQQHRDRQRTDAAGHRRQRAGDLRDVRMHVADDERAALLERLAPLRSRREQLLDDRAIASTG